MISSEFVSIVIINFNSGKYVFRCLDQVFKQDYPYIEIIVVDNASTDNSRKFLEKLNDQKKIKYIYSDKNLGSSAANNLGIKNSIGKYILVLNADVFMEPNYISECLRGFDQYSEVGTVVGKLISSKDSRILDSTGIELYIEGVAGERGMGEVDKKQYDTPDFIVGACCAAAIYKRSMLEEISFEGEYFDESFFAFVEDLDLSVRALLKGWKTLYWPKAVGQHVRGGATSDMSDFVSYLNYRNFEFFYYKCMCNTSLNLGKKNLNFIRNFTISKQTKERYDKDFELSKTLLEAKRKQIESWANYKNLNEYLRKSYVYWNIKKRAKKYLRRFASKSM